MKLAVRVIFALVNYKQMSALTIDRKIINIIKIPIVDKIANDQLLCSM